MAVDYRWLLILACAGFCSCMSDPKDCCDQGTTQGRRIITDTNTSECGQPPAALTAKDKIFSKLLCVGMFHSCCKIAASSQYCLVGVRMAMANQECEGADGDAGIKQKTCCDCCKKGKQQAAKQESCAKVTVDGGSETCQASYKDCCMKTKEMTSPNLRTCATLQCSTTTQNCVDGETGAKCVCKKGTGIRSLWNPFFFRVIFSGKCLHVPGKWITTRPGAPRSVKLKSIKPKSGYKNHDQMT
jgi:hypothetical protein